MNTEEFSYEKTNGIISVAADDKFHTDIVLRPKENIAKIDRILALNDDTDNKKVALRADIIPTIDRYIFLNSCFNNLYSINAIKISIENNPKYAPRHPV